jgi:hypothetical protein
VEVAQQKRNVVEKTQIVECDKIVNMFIAKKKKSSPRGC